jgi:hypothetical protein
MKKTILLYRQKIDCILELEDKATDWNNVEKQHLVHIEFFQHERMVHLIVTVTVAVLEFMSVLLMFMECNYFTMALVLLFFVLLVPYIGHYYFLENEIQKMYQQYDDIVKMEV